MSPMGRQGCEKPESTTEVGTTRDEPACDFGSLPKDFSYALRIFSASLLNSTASARKRILRKRGGRSIDYRPHSVGSEEMQSEKCKMQNESEQVRSGKCELRTEEQWAMKSERNIKGALLISGARPSERKYYECMS